MKELREPLTRSEVLVLDGYMAYIHPAETIFSSDQVELARLQIQSILGNRIEVEQTTNKELYEYINNLVDIYTSEPEE